MAAPVSALILIKIFYWFSIPVFQKVLWITYNFDRFIVVFNIVKSSELFLLIYCEILDFSIEPTMISSKVVWFVLSIFTAMSFSSLPQITNTNVCVGIDLQNSKQMPFLTHSIYRSTLFQLSNSKCDSKSSKSTIHTLRQLHIFRHRVAGH